MRICWSSNGYHVNTGYGVETRLIIPRLFALGHQVGLFAWWGLEGGALNMSVEHHGQVYDLPVYPKGKHGYGNDLVGAHASRGFQADIVISLIDAWVLDAEAHSPGNTRFAPYFPVDCEPIPPPVLNVVKDSFQPIVYSRFGERMARNAGLDVRFVPHMIDTNLFCPGDKRAAREALGWQQDAFIVGMVAANKGFPSRKAFPEQIRAFAQVAERHSDMRLYLHTNDGADDGRGGVNLPELCRAEEIAGRVTFPEAYTYAMGYADEQMVNVYRGLDVLLSVSMGEGFGIPIVEAQACACPVIVGDWTSMSELCFGGWKIAKEDATPMYQPLAADQFMPRVGAIAETLETAYQEARHAFYGQRARAGALEYDADLVAETYWKPVLDEISDRMGLARAGEVLEMPAQEARVAA